MMMSLLTAHGTRSLVEFAIDTAALSLFGACKYLLLNRSSLPWPRRALAFLIVLLCLHTLRELFAGLVIPPK